MDPDLGPEKQSISKEIGASNFILLLFTLQCSGVLEGAIDVEGVGEDG